MFRVIGAPFSRSETRNRYPRGLERAVVVSQVPRVEPSPTDPSENNSAGDVLIAAFQDAGSVLSVKLFRVVLKIANFVGG